MAHSRSHSQPVHYRYRPNAPVRAATTASSKLDQGLGHQSSQSAYYVSQLANTPLYASQAGAALKHSYIQTASDVGLSHGASLFSPIDETTLAFQSGLQSIDYPSLESPQISPWFSSNSSMSDTCSGSWSSPASTMGFSPEPQYQVPCMENASWPPQTQSSFFSPNCISMPEVFPAFPLDPGYATSPSYYPQLAQQWPNQFMGDGLPPAFETTEYCSSHGSPDNLSEQAGRSSDTVVGTKSRSDSMMTDASTVSSPCSSTKGTNLPSPSRAKSQFEGQLLEFSTPVAQAKSKGSKSAALPCPLAPYGCSSSFISKNEWKRHINTQHLRLEAWLCDQCPKRDNKREFNRKDLFIQHLKRMHPPACPAHTPKAPQTKSKATRSLSNTDKATKSSKGEDLDPALLMAEQRCHIVLRQPPADSGCLFCPTNFSGRGSWEARIEHVAKHMEQFKKDGSEVPEPKTWRTDRALEQWLASEGVISKVRQRWSVA